MKNISLHPPIHQHIATGTLFLPTFALRQDTTNTHRHLKNSSKKRAKKQPSISSDTLTQQNFDSINRRQQLLLMQSLWLGQSKDSIVLDLDKRPLEIVAFAHWLAVPVWGVLLNFSHQKCINIDWL